MVPHIGRIADDQRGFLAFGDGRYSLREVAEDEIQARARPKRPGGPAVVRIDFIPLRGCHPAGRKGRQQGRVERTCPEGWVEEPNGSVSRQERPGQAQHLFRQRRRGGELPQPVPLTAALAGVQLRLERKPAVRSCLRPLVHGSQTEPGQVAMRRICTTSGCADSTAGETSRRLPVQRSASSTFAAVFCLVWRYALGAKRRNQLLKKSTDLAMSSFHSCGLSAFTAMAPSPPFLRIRFNDHYA